MFSNVYIHSSSFIKNNFCENLPERIFCALAFESKRERKRHRLVRRAQTLCASSSCYKSYYPRRQTSISLKAPQIV